MRLAIIAGIHWIIEICANLIGDPRLYFVAFVFFIIQGPIIFVSFVCNSRVKYFLKKRHENYSSSSKPKKFASRIDITGDNLTSTNKYEFDKYEDLENFWIM